MNKIYKLVWSKTRNMYIAVCEFAKSHSKTKSIVRKEDMFCFGMVLCYSLLFPLTTFAYTDDDINFLNLLRGTGNNLGSNSNFSIGGNNNTVLWNSGDHDTAYNNKFLFGNNNKISGFAGSTDNVILGSSNTLGMHNTNNFIFGNDNLIDEFTSNGITLGFDNHVGYTSNPIVIGFSNTISDGGYSDNSIIIGRNSSIKHNSDGSVLIGKGDIDNSHNSVLLGNFSKIVNTPGSIAINGNVERSENNNELKNAGIAIGIGSSANESVSLGSYSYSKNNSVSLGNESTTGNEVDSVISVGHKIGDVDVRRPIDGQYEENLFRRIINVEDGVSDHDVVTVGQLNRVMGSIGEGIGVNDTLNFVMYDNNNPTLPDYHTVISLNEPGVGSGVKITNLADGEISAESTDAVNGSQLYEIIGNAEHIHYLGINPSHEQYSPGGNYNGEGARSTGSIALGKNAYAQGENNIAIGVNSRTQKDLNDITDTLSIGTKSHASGDKSIAVGKNSWSRGESSIALGEDAYAEALNTISIGKLSYAGGSSNSVAVGTNSFISNQSPNSVALGSDSVVNNNQSNVISIGHKAGDIKLVSKNDIDYVRSTYNDDLYRRIINVADGVNVHDVATVGQLNNLNTYISTLGTKVNGAVVYDNNDALSGGYHSTISLQEQREGAGVRITKLAKGSVEPYSVDAINGSQLYETNQMVNTLSEQSHLDYDKNYIKANDTVANNLITLDSFVKKNADAIDELNYYRDSSINIGGKVAHGFYDALVIGYSAEASTNGTAIGYDTKAFGSRSVALGYGSEALGQNALAIAGGKITVNGDYGYAQIAIGMNSESTDSYGIAFGSDSKAFGESSLAVGHGAIASNKNSSAFGDNSKASGENSTALGYNSNAIGTCSVAIAGGVSGDTSIAVGGSVSAKNSVALGFGSIANQDDIVSVGKTNLKRRIVNVANGIDRNDVVTVGQLNDAIVNLNNNFSNISNENTIAYDSVDHSILTLNGSKGTKITNAKQASLNRTSTDVVIGAQLWATNQNIAGFANDIKMNSNNITTLNTGITNALNSVSAVSASKADISLSNLNAGGRSIIASVASEVLDEYLSNNSNSSTTGNLTMSTHRTVGLKSTPLASSANDEVVVTNNDDLNSNGDNIINPATQDALDTKVNVSDFNDSMDLKADKNSVYSKDETDTLLGNKADKANTLKGYGIEDAYTKEDTDTLLNKKADKTALDEVKAITESNQKALAELTNVNELIEETETIKKRIDDMEIMVGSDAVLMTTNNSDMITASTDSIEIGSDAGYDDLNSISIAKSDGSGRVLRGVITDPEDNNSAANVGYVNAIGEGIIAGVNGKFAKVDDKINKVGAGAAAMASLTPANYDGDEKWTLSASVGNYRDATAGAVGLFYRPSDKVMVNVRGTIGNEENMVGGGIAVVLDKGTAPGVTKAQMVRTISAQAEEIQSIKAEREADKQHIAQQDKEIAELKAIMQKLLKDNSSSK